MNFTKIFCKNIGVANFSQLSKNKVLDKLIKNLPKHKPTDPNAKPVRITKKQLDDLSKEIKNNRKNSVYG
jgi:hypothetical protein